MENRIEIENQNEKKNVFESDEEVVCDNISLEFERQLHSDANNNEEDRTN